MTETSSPPKAPSSVVPGSSASPMAADQFALEPILEPDAPGLVTVARYPTVIEAELARSRLEAAEIRAFVVDQATATVAPHLSLAIGGLRLSVAEVDAERAQELLAEEQLARPEEVSFRVVTDHAVTGAALGLGLGALCFFALFAARMPPRVGVLVGAILSAAGWWIGGRFKVAWCSRSGCAKRMPLDAARCPGCQAPVAGEILNAAERLEAEERLADQRESES